MHIRGVAEASESIFGEHVSPTTVQKLLEEAGDYAQIFLERNLVDLPCKHIEIDELYAIVGVHPRNIATMKRTGMEAQFGEFWIWIAIDSVSKLIVGWHVGGRDEESTRIILSQVKTRVRNRFQLTTDSLRSYIKWVPEIFSDPDRDLVDYATVKKTDPDKEKARIAAEKAGRRYTPARPSVEKKERSPPVRQLGDPDLALATTNHIEAFFTQLRKSMPRLTRRSTMISKNLTNLRRAVALHVFDHNYVKKHYALGTTPAAYLRLESSPLKWTDFVDLLNGHQAAILEARRAAAKSETLAAVAEAKLRPLRALTYEAAEAPLDFTVFENLIQKTAKVHRTTCKHLRSIDVAQGANSTGRRFYCCTQADAIKLAEEIRPGFSSVCKMCLAERHWLDWYDPNRDALKKK